MENQDYNEMTEADYYRAAADHLMQYGWQQHKMGSSGGRCCVHGAVTAAGGDPSYRGRTALFAEVRRRVGHSSITVYNDSPDRTVDEVIDLLLTAAARAEGVL